MKEIRVLVGADIHDVFRKAIEEVRITGKPVTFLFNRFRVIVLKEGE